MTAAASVCPGFLGAGLLRPSAAGDPWHVVFRFDSAETLHAWESSAERASLLSAGDHLVEATDVRRVSGLETWFDLPGRHLPAPPKWKMFVVSATVFASLNLLLSWAYGPALTGLPLPVRVALISVPVTALATWVVMPRVAQLLRRWLYGPRRR